MLLHIHFLFSFSYPLLLLLLLLLLLHPNHLYAMHVSLEEWVVEVRDDWTEWIDVARVHQLLWVTELGNRR